MQLVESRQRLNRPAEIVRVDLAILLSESVAQLTSRLTDSVVTRLLQLGFRVEAPAKLPGRSGVEHPASIAATGGNGKRLLADLVVLEGEADEVPVISTYAKVLDTSPSEAYMIVVPKATELARKLANSYNIRLIEGSNVEEILAQFGLAISRAINPRGNEAMPAKVWRPLGPRTVSCYKCGYTWETKSRLKFVTCPSCHYKIDSERSSAPTQTKQQPAGA